jgi:hypothetical protein
MRPQLAAGTRSLEIKLVRPDGSREVLLWMKDAHQLWPTQYVFKKPVAMPVGSTLRAVAYFDRAPTAANTAAITLAINHFAEKRGGVR